MTALYLHIPFCRSKCHYCSFSSCANAEPLYEPYIAALMREMDNIAGQEGIAGGEGLATLFIGGGTPTCLPSELLQRLIRRAIDLFGLAAGAEISVEANPGTVDSNSLESLLALGVNRLSLGVQSFADRELGTIGRIHSGDDAESAVQAALSAGFTNVNLDLMFGLPGQTPGSWQNSLQRALALSPQHLSLYQLTIEPNTPFHSLLHNHALRLPTEDDILAMDASTERLSRSAGLLQYETSNYAAQGYQCRHNINYWHNNDYFAAGASAVSCLLGVRERRVADPAAYIRRINHHESVVIEREKLPREDSFRETVIMGLRLVQGVSRAVLYERYGLDIAAYYGLILKKLLALGLVELTATHLRISKRGWPLANQIMADLV